MESLTLETSAKQIDLNQILNGTLAELKKCMESSDEDFCTTIMGKPQIPQLATQFIEIYNSILKTKLTPENFTNSILAKKVQEGFRLCLTFYLRITTMKDSPSLSDATYTKFLDKIATDRVFDLVKLVGILEVYSTATNLAKRGSKEKNEDGENVGSDFISSDTMIMAALGQLAGYVTYNDLGQVSNLNSFLFIRKVFSRQLGFWKDQNNQDALHSLVGIPEALLMERTQQIDKLHDFVVCLTAYVKICPEFCLYLVPSEHETLSIIEFIYMTTLAMLPNANKFTIKEQVRTDFRKSVFGFLDLCARFWDQIFSQLNSQLMERILRGRTLKNKQGIAKNFYKAHCEEMFMETMGFVTAHMEQSRINGKKRSVKFLKI
jgi:hypothetical protein